MHKELHLFERMELVSVSMQDALGLVHNCRQSSQPLMARPSPTAVFG